MKRLSLLSQSCSLRVRIAPQIGRVSMRRRPLSSRTQLGLLGDFPEHGRARLGGAIQAGHERIPEGICGRDVAPDFAAAELAGMEVNIRASFPKMGELGRERRSVTFRRIPFSVEYPAHGRATADDRVWRTTASFGLLSLTECREAPDNPAIRRA